MKFLLLNLALLVSLSAFAQEEPHFDFEINNDQIAEELSTPNEASKSVCHLPCTGDSVFCAYGQWYQCVDGCLEIVDSGICPQ